MPFTGERLTPEILSATILTEHLHRYAMATNYCTGKEVLDIASGEGYGSQILSKVALHVTGVDIDESSVAYAQGKYKLSNLQFLVGSTDRIPIPDNSVDVVVSFETIEHHDKHEEMIQEIKRVLRPDGLLLISTPEKKYYSDATNYKNPFHVKELYGHEFESLLKKYFSNVQVLAQQSGVISVVYPLGKQIVVDGWLSKGNTNSIEIVKNTEPMYLIALASELKVEESALSFFKDNNMVEEIAKRQIQDIVNSKTYQLGKIIAMPYVWIKSLFRK